MIGATWLGVDAGVWLVVLAMVLIGAVVQGVVGFGLGIVAAPIVAGVAPELMPGALIVASMPLPLLTLGGEWRSIDWRALGWLMVGRLPATAVGVALVAVIPVRALQLIVAASVLLALALSLFRLEVPRNRGTLAGAGAVAGITGTTSAIGGPPLAIVLRNDEPAQARATMAVYFLVGAVLSLTGLTLTGSIQPSSLAIGALGTPAAVLGFLVALRLRRHVAGGRFRTAITAVSAVAAVVLLVRAL